MGETETKGATHSRPDGVETDATRVFTEPGTKLVPGTLSSYTCTSSNQDEARKDAADQEAIVASLPEKLQTGEKSLSGNQGYRRYLCPTGPDHFQIGEAKIVEEACYDGKWVLRTNTELDAAEVALQYKWLWMVESTFGCANRCPDPADLSQV